MKAGQREPSARNTARVTEGNRALSTPPKAVAQTRSPRPEGGRAAEKRGKNGAAKPSKKNAPAKAAQKPAAKSRDKPKGRRHDWGKMRAEYVSSTISQRDLAQKYGASLSQVSKICSKEGWTKKRQEHWRKTSEKAEQKLSERQAEQMADQLEDIRKAGDNLARMIADVTADGKSVKKGAKTDTKAVKNLTSALKDVLDVLRDVYELPNLRDKSKLEQATGAAEVRVVIEDGGGPQEGLTAGKPNPEEDKPCAQKQTP